MPHHQQLLSGLSASGAAMRACGPCYSCCVVFEIEGLPGYNGASKPAGEACMHLINRRDGGKWCGIYDERPPACQEFRCLWLQCFGVAAERPDRLGVIAWDNPDNASLDRSRPITTMEACPGSYESIRASLFLEELRIRTGRGVIKIVPGREASLLR